jgi:hypothetical protein
METILYWFRLTLNLLNFCNGFVSLLICEFGEICSKDKGFPVSKNKTELPNVCSDFQVCADWL